MDESFEEFSKWCLKKFPNSSASDLMKTFELRKRLREQEREFIKEELIKYGLIDEYGKRLGVQYNGT